MILMRARPSVARRSRDMAQKRTDGSRGTATDDGDSAGERESSSNNFLLSLTWGTCSVRYAVPCYTSESLNDGQFSPSRGNRSSLPWRNDRL